MGYNHVFFDIWSKLLSFATLCSLLLDVFLGDVEKPVTVVCYTESKSATGSERGRIQSGSDYRTRSQGSEDSIITFAPGKSNLQYL